MLFMTLQRMIGSLKMFVRQKLLHNRTFPGVAEYWERRYAAGGHSGSGSYGALAGYKAQYLNAFVKDHDIESVIEFGCGDGNQLTLATYPAYIGLDISVSAVRQCIQMFKEDKTKSFYLYNSLAFQDQHGLFQADLALSLDVIFHLVEDDVYEGYMEHLFGAAKSYVIIYSSNDEAGQKYHEKHRRFVDWVSEHAPAFELIHVEKNPHRYDRSAPSDTSHSDFFMFKKRDGLNPEANEG
jgi:hypothetical protein